MSMNAETGDQAVVNGTSRPRPSDPRTTLLDWLRDGLGLTGAKKGCNHGQCGACTVHVDGRRVLSCLTLAATVDGAVTTIEGLPSEDHGSAVADGNGAMHPMQRAFLRHDAYQCGYCTPGQIMSAVALVREGGANSPAAIREAMSGNLCRCSVQPAIVAAIEEARDEMLEGRGRRPGGGER